LITVSFFGFSVKKDLKFDEKGNISIIIEGHSNTGSRGNDIICSAVSVLAQTMVLSLGKIAKIKQKVDQRDGFLKTEFNLSDLTEDTKLKIKIIIDFFCIGIFEIKKEYPESLKINM